MKRASRNSLIPVLLLAACLSCAGAVTQVAAQLPPRDSFAGLVAELSEPGGYFDTDNLISNEKSYLHVIGELARRGVAGGVYIGVGPDQNFSYIARVRPTAAVIVDIRRDNLLLHLLFRAIFEQAPTRVEYLCLLTGRAPPERLSEEHAEWRAAGIEKLAAYVDIAPRTTSGVPGVSGLEAATRQRLEKNIAGFGVPLSAADYATIARFHQAFMSKGLGLQFQTLGRPIQSYNPTYRDLLTERDQDGRQRSFLASEEDYQFLRALERAGKVIPVVGDVAGKQAMPAIAAWMRREKLTLSTLYISNVEDYLFRGGTFAAYMANVKGLPHAPSSVVIRSVFRGGRRANSIQPGYASASLLQNLDDMLTHYAAGKYESYYDLIGD